MISLHQNSPYGNSDTICNFSKAALGLTTTTFLGEINRSDLSSLPFLFHFTSIKLQGLLHFSILAAQQMELGLPSINNSTVLKTQYQSL